MSTEIRVFYIGQPYSYNPAESYQKAIEYAIRMYELGHLFFSPILHSHPFASAFPAERFIEFDLKWIESFRPTLLFASGWQKSEGCRMEYAKALELGLLCWDLDPFLERGLTVNVCMT